MRWQTALLALSLSAATDATYTTSVQQWRTAREAKLKANDGWLTVAGLFWLKPGANTFGTGQDQAIVLPAGGPSTVGVFRLANGLVTLEPADLRRSAKGGTVKQTNGVTASLEDVLKVNGKPAAAGALKSDKSGQPDMVTWGRLTMFVIQRGPRFAIRLRDPNSQFRKEFTSLNWYLINPALRVTGQYEPYPAKRHVKIDTIIGEPEDMVAPGKVTFALNGQTVSLEPVEDEGKLWFIFRDGTTGKSTYGGGRFLYSELPKEGRVVLDFNEAYNPPCVFTPYATCPLPQPQNRLTVLIQAGEKRYGQH